MSLSRRNGLPEALRALVDDYPRSDWPGHSNFDEMVRFWLERHLMFRKLLGQLRADVEAYQDKSLGFESYAPRLQRLGSLFLSELHTHHSVEDHHYFPKIAPLEGSLQRGFDLLDQDHHALDDIMQRFGEMANVVLQGNEAGPFYEVLLKFEGFLDRHLTDEEELVVPVLLKHGPLD